MSAIEKIAPLPPHALRHCDSLLGEVFHLYQYKKYTDVLWSSHPSSKRLFCGDPDNFTTRVTILDISFFRIYENDKPVHLDNFLKWSKRE